MVSDMNVVNNETVNNFISSLTENARLTADKLNDETSELIKSEIEAYEISLKVKYDDYIKKQKAQIRSEIMSASAKRELEQKSALFKKRIRIIEDVFDKAQDKLVIFQKSDKYLNLLIRLIKHTADKLGDAEISLVVSDRDKGIADDLERHFDCEVTVDDSISGGVLICINGTNHNINYTFDSLLDDARERFLMTEELRISI